MKKLILFSALIIITATFLIFADFNTVIYKIHQFGIRHTVMLFGLQIISMILINLQWYRIFKKMNITVKFSEIIKMNMIGSFFDSITPAVKAGGEAAKTVYLKKKLKISSENALSGIAIQKVISIICFLCLCAISLIWMFFKDSLDNKLHGSLIIYFIITIIIVVVPIFIIFLAGKIRNHKLRLIIQSFKTGMKNIREDFFIHIALGISIWFLYAVKAYYITNILNINIDFPAIASVTYLSYMTAMIPLLPGGMGTFEAAMTILLETFGINGPNGLIIAVILRVATFWFVLAVSGTYIGASALIEKIKKMKEKTHEFKKIYS